MLVFSKTSLQRGRIRPERPRALYFSDTAYVGWVPGGLIEVITIDPHLGPVFYSFEIPSAGGSPKIQRDTDCLRCHGGTFVRDIPGVFVRSVFPDGNGEPLLRLSHARHPKQPARMPLPSTSAGMAEPCGRRPWPVPR